MVELGQPRSSIGVAVSSGLTSFLKSLLFFIGHYLSPRSQVLSEDCLRLCLVSQRNDTARGTSVRCINSLGNYYCLYCANFKDTLLPLFPIIQLHLIYQASYPRSPWLRGLFAALFPIVLQSVVNITVDSKEGRIIEKPSNETSKTGNGFSKSIIFLEGMLSFPSNQNFVPKYLSWFPNLLSHNFQSLINA